MRTPPHSRHVFTTATFWIWCVLVLVAAVLFLAISPSPWTISAAIAITAAVTWLIWDRYRGDDRQ